MGSDSPVKAPTSAPTARDVKCVDGSPAWLLSNKLTAQTYLPRMCANASNSAHSWTAEEPAGHPHLPWVSEICSTAERACWIPASPFSQLLHARRALIGHEFDNFFVEHPERICSNRPSAGALSTELPSTVILGLTTFNVVLKSLCAERHDLEVEVTSSVCSVLQGLPPLTEVRECEASVLDSLEKLLMDLVDTSISRVALCEADAERIGGSLKALFLLSLLRSSLTGIVRAAHLTFRAEEALVAAGCRTDAIKMDISGPHLEALKELCEGGGFGEDLSPLSDDSTILGDFNDDVVMGARPNLVFSNSYSSIATDGRYLYKHTLNGISKMGSGYGSEASKLYLEGSALSGTPGWLAHVQATEGSALGWLFFMPRGGSDRLECVDPTDLSLSAPVYFPPHFGKMVGPLMSHGSMVYIVAEEPVSTTFKVHIFELVNEEAESKGQGSREGHERTASLQDGGKRAGTRAESLRLLHVRSMRLIAPADEDHAQSSQSVHTCGLNRKYELGEGAQGETVDPDVISSMRAMPIRTVSLAAGNDSNFLLMEDGRVLATGNVDRLSIGGNRPSSSVVDYMDLLPKGRKAVNVCSYNGSEHVLVLGDDGRVYATGNNRYGQLGIGSLDTCQSPTLVLLPKRAVASLSCCYNHSVAVMADGVAYAFGLNDYGQLGSGSLERQMTPGIMRMPVGERVVGASCGQFHTVVWTQSGFAYATGRNNLGQLGTGRLRESSKILTLVPGLSGLVQMACGYSHTCAVTVTDEPHGATTRSVYAWGCNSQGQLGLGHVANAYSPASLDSLADCKVVKVTCGAHHTAVLTGDSLVYAFGNNTHGQLGQQDSSSQCRPLEISGLRGKKVVDIACGLHHIIALSSDSNVPPVAASSFDPELSSWYTNGSELCVHFPHRTEADGKSESGERSNVDVGGCGHDRVQSTMTSRCFSLLTGAHMSDSSSLLHEDSSVAFDRVRGVLWVSDGLSGHYSVYSNIGRLHAPYIPPGSELRIFPAISEALLSHPRNAAVVRPLPVIEGQTPEVACARSCSLALLSLLDIGSRSSFDCWRVEEVSRGNAFFALRDLLAYVVPRLDASEENVQLCILAMRMVRVNIQGLNAGIEGLEGDRTRSVTKVLHEILPILANNTLLHTPILFECCKVLVEGIDYLSFASDDQDHQGLVFISGLIGRLPGVSPKPPFSTEGSQAKAAMMPGELLLIKIFLESVADSDLATRKLAPSPNDGSQFHQSFRLLMDQLIGIASGASKDTGVDRLLASRALTVLLKGYCARCKGQIQDSTEPRVNRADSLQHPTLVSSSNSELVVMPIIIHILEAAVTSECLEQGGHFVTDLLPWACTACMLFLDDFDHAKQALPVVVSACTKLQQWFPVSAPSRDLDGDAAVVESAHPCEGSETEVHHVHIPGATFLILNFDPRTNIRDVDRIRLYNELECRAEPLMQLDGSFDQWLSVPWLIAGDECSITFESGQLNTSGPTLDTWGFRCVVTGVADEIDTYSWGQYASQATALLAAECGKRVAAGPKATKESREDMVQKEIVELFDRHFVWQGCASQPLCAKLGASPILKQLVSGDEGAHAWMESVMIDTCVSEACETLGSRHWWHYRVRCIALACILHSSIVIAAEDEEIRSMWKETARLRTWADQAQQQAAARRDSAVGAWEAVIEELQRKASFILNSQPRLDMVWTQSVKAIVAYLTDATLNECQLTARIDAINQGVKDRAQVINAFSSLIEVGGSSMIRLLTNVIPTNLLRRVPMVDPKLQARLAGDVSGLLKKLKDAGRTCGDGGWKEEMEVRAVFLNAIAALGADVASIGPDCMGLIDGMWDICCSPSAPLQDEQIDSKPRIEPGQVLEYTSWASPGCDVKNKESRVQTGCTNLTSSKSDLCWVQVKVVCRCEGDDVLVEAWDGQEGLPGVGRFRVKATSLTPCVSPVKPGKICEGAEVDIWSDIQCKVPGFEDGSVLPTVKGWVPGVLLEWSEWSPGFAQVQKGNLSIETAYVRPRKPLPPWKLRAHVEVSRDLSSKAKVSVSSNSRAVGKLTDCNPDSYWQSDGLRQSDGSRLHWISLVFPRRVRLASVAIFCDYFKDKSFSPKRVSVRCGDNRRGDLHLLSETTIGTESYGWVTIHSHPTDVWEGTVVRIGIHECHEGGCNSRVRGVQVMSTWASSCEDSSPGIESIGRLTAPAHACNFPDLRKASGKTLLVTCASALQRRRERGHHCGLSRRSLSLVLQLLRSFLKARSRRFDDSSSITELTEFLLNLDPSSPAVREEVTSEESLDALASALEAHPWPNQAGILRLIRTFLPYASSQLGGQKNLVSRLLAIAGSSLLTPPQGDGLGLHWSLGVQIVYLLRQLATLDAWRAPVSNALKAAMHLGKLALPKERRSQCTFAGALCVLGGCVDGLRPGCTVIRGSRCTVESCSHDSAAARLSGGPVVSTSSLKVEDEVPPPSVFQNETTFENLLEVMDGLRKSRKESPAGSPTTIDSQLWAMASACVRWHIQSLATPQGGLLMQSLAVPQRGLLERLLAIEEASPKARGGSSLLANATGSVDLYMPLFEVIRHRHLHGERAVKDLPLPQRTDGGPRSPQKQKPIEFPRDPAIEALAAELTGLGYNQAICTVALRLNGGNAQAAGAWLLDHSEAYAEAHPEVLAEAVTLDEESPDAYDVSSSSLVQLQAVENEWQMYQMPRAYPGATWEDAVSPSVHSAPHIESVYRGQLLCVSNCVSSKQFDAADLPSHEEMIGRCGEVRAVNMDAGMATLEFCEPVSPRTLSMHTFPIDLLSRPDHAVEDGWGFALSLRGEALTEAFEELLGDRSRYNLRAAICRLLCVGTDSVQRSVAPRLCRLVVDHLATRQSGPATPLLLLRTRLSTLIGCEGGVNLGSDGGLLESIKYQDSYWEEAPEVVSSDDRSLGSTWCAEGAIEEIEAHLQECGSFFRDSLATFESGHPCKANLADDPQPVCVTVPKGGGYAVFDVRSNLPSGYHLRFCSDEHGIEEIHSFGRKGHDSFAPTPLPEGELWLCEKGSATSIDTSWGYRVTVVPASLPRLAEAKLMTFLLGPSSLPSHLASRLVDAVYHLWAGMRVPCQVREEVALLMACILRSLHGSVHEEVRSTACKVMQDVRAEISWRTDPSGGREHPRNESGKEVSIYLQSLFEVLVSCLPWQAAAEPLATSLDSNLASDDHRQERDQDMKDLEDFVVARGTMNLPRFLTDVQAMQATVHSLGVVPSEIKAILPTVRISLPQKHSAEADKALQETLAFATYFLGEERRPLPDDLLCQAWLCARSRPNDSYAVRESSQHPYKQGCVESGHVEFPGAEQLHVYVDGQSSTDGDDYLNFSLTEAGTGNSSTCIAAYSGGFGASRAGQRLTVLGSSIWYSFTGQHGSDWGYRFTVIPWYSQKQRIERLKGDAATLRFAAAAMQEMTIEDDAELVRLINQVSDEDSLILPPAMITSALAGSNRSSYKRIAQMPPLLVHARIALLQRLNLAVSTHLLPYANLSLEHHDGSIANILSRIRDLLFFNVKSSFLSSCLLASKSSKDITVVVDRRSDEPVLKQLATHLSRVPRSHLKSCGMAFRVQFAGEGARGDSGPYRECLSTACSDLEGDKLRLLIPCPNMQTGVGEYSHTHVIRPSATTPADYEMLELMGVLFGISLRTRIPLDLTINPLVWLMVLGRPPPPGALALVDASSNRVLESFKSPEASFDEESFEEDMGLSFQVALSDGTSVELCENGCNMAVTWDNREEYVKMAERTRLGESRTQAAVVRNSMHRIVPRGPLSLLSWDELDRLVTGSSSMNVSLLRQHTVYRGVEETDESVERFWEVIEGFSAEERKNFLRFVWGRSRLPRAAQFTEPFKLHVMGTCGDERLPKADTCFFTLHLPLYSSTAVMRERLLYSISHCTDMDLM